MLASDTERSRVTRLLSRSLPDYDDRLAVVRAAGLSDVQVTGAPADAWRLLVDEALLQGRFLPLVQAAAARRPDDAAIERLAVGVLAGRVDVGPPVPLSVAGLVVLGAILLAVAALMMPTGAGRMDDGPRDGPNPDAVAVAPSSAATGPEVRVEVLSDASREEDAGAGSEPPPGASTTRVTEQAAASTPADPSGAPPEPAATEPGEASEQQAASTVPAAPEPTPTATAPASTPTGEGCSGFAWLGSSTDLSAGDVWTVEDPTNVRADYPRRENGWSPRSARVCGLTSGRRVRLGEDPILVDGGAVWVRVEEAWFLPEGSGD